MGTRIPVWVTRRWKQTSNVIQIRNDGSARCRVGHPERLRGWANPLQDPGRCQRHRGVASTIAPTIEDALDDPRNFLTDEFESEEYHPRHR
jgi:hypothetical protein